MTVAVLIFSQTKLLVFLIPSLIVVYSTIFITQKYIRKLEILIGKTFQEGTFVALLLGFPLFFLGYRLTTITLKEILSNNKL